MLSDVEPALLSGSMSLSADFCRWDDRCMQTVVAAQPVQSIDKLKEAIAFQMYLYNQQLLAIRDRCLKLDASFCAQSNLSVPDHRVCRYMKIASYPLSQSLFSTG